MPPWCEDARTRHAVVTAMRVRAPRIRITCLPAVSLPDSVTGRAKEMIIIRGANFYCYEIEELVTQVCACVRKRERPPRPRRAADPDGPDALRAGHAKSPAREGG